MVGKTTLYTDGTFIINELKADRNTNIGLYGAVVEEYDPWLTDTDYVFATSPSRPWYAKKDDINSVKFGSSVMPVSMKHWFNANSNLQTIDFTNLISSACTDMSYLFQSCTRLLSIDVGSLRTGNVTNFTQMFGTCRGLRTITGLNSWDTSSATTFNWMFGNCEMVSAFDLSSWNTANVTDMRSMFGGCRAARTINIRGFDTRKVTNMWRMFYNNLLLTTIYASTNFITTQVTESNYMFTGDTMLRGGYGTVYNVNYVDKVRAKIDGGTSSPGYFTE